MELLREGLTVLQMHAEREKAAHGACRLTDHSEGTHKALDT